MKPEEIIETAYRHADRYWEGFDKAAEEMRHSLKALDEYRGEETMLGYIEWLETSAMQQECEYACIPFHGWMLNVSLCMRERGDHSNAYTLEKECDRLFDPFAPESAIGIFKEMRMGKLYGNPYFEKVFGIKEKDLPFVEFD